MRLLPIQRFQICMAGSVHFAQSGGLTDPSASHVHEDQTSVGKINSQNRTEATCSDQSVANVPLKQWHRSNFRN